MTELSSKQKELLGNIKELLSSEQNFAQYIRSLLESYVVQLAPSLDQAKGVISNIKQQESTFADITYMQEKFQTTNEDQLQNIACVTTPVFQEQKQGKQASYLSNSDWTSLFQFLPVLFNVSLMFISQLQKVICNKSNEELLNSLQEICTTINDWSPNIIKYDTYVAAYDFNLEKLRQLESKNESIKNKLQEIKQMPQAFSKDIYSYLIMPVQRVPRYTLFIQNFVKLNCDENLKDVLEKTLSNVVLKAKQIDANIADHNNREVLRNISSQISSPPKDLVLPHRKLVKEGSLIKFCRKDDKARKLFLFNDALMYCTIVGGDDNNKYIWPKLYTLKGCVCEPIQGQPTQIQISTNKKSFILQARVQKERDDWMKSIQQVIDEQKENVLQQNVDQAAPVWVQDAKQVACYLCHTEFTFFTRRHHCRQCGQVICNQCSQGRHVLINISQINKQRLCDICMSKLDTTWKGNLANAVKPQMQSTVKYAVVETMNPLLDFLRTNQQ